jgi:hypothetical protein
VASEDVLDYHQAVQTLNGWAGETVLVYPAAHADTIEQLKESYTTAGLSIWGKFKPLPDIAAGARRKLSDAFEDIRPELALGDAPLELYERQAAFYTFERMGDGFEEHAGFALWAHEFVEARWVPFGGRYLWLWIRTTAPTDLVVAVESEPLRGNR